MANINTETGTHPLFHPAAHYVTPTDDGLLQIDLVRKIPEAMKPRKIAIGSGAKPIKSLTAA
jgi:hypothetical protein